MNKPLNCAEGLIFINSLIAGSDAECKVQSFFKARYLRIMLDDDAPYEVGVGYWKGFMKRNKRRLKTSKGARLEWA